MLEVSTWANLYRPEAANMLPSVGSVDVEVRAVQQISLHGDHYFDLVISRFAAESAEPPAPTPTAEPTFRSARVAAAAFAGRPPKSGDVLRLQCLLGQLTEAKYLR